MFVTSISLLCWGVRGLSSGGAVLADGRGVRGTCSISGQH